MDEREKKTIALFVIVVSTFYSMLESPEAKKDFVKVLDRLKKKTESETQ
jgi:hypothetical protein